MKKSTTIFTRVKENIIIAAFTLMIIVCSSQYLIAQTTLTDLGRLSTKTPITPGVYNGSATYQNYLYIAGTGSIYIYNATDPKNPAYVKTIPIYSETGGARRVWTGEKYLFVYTGGRIKIYDLTNPENPVFKSNYLTGEDLHKVSAKGNYMFVFYMTDIQTGKYGSFQIVDISNPDSARLKGTYKPGNYEGRSFFFSETANRVYVAHYNNPTKQGFIREIDYSDPANPIQVRELIISGAPVEISVSDSTMFVLKDGGWEGPSKLEAYNLSVTPITQLASQQVSTGRAWDLHVYVNSITVTLLETNGFQNYTWNGTTNTFENGLALNIPNASQMSWFMVSTQGNGGNETLRKTLRSYLVSFYYYIVEKSTSSLESETYGYYERLVKVDMWINERPGSKVTLITSVNPAEAAGDGCSVTPSGTNQFDINSNAILDANSGTGWIWDKWTGSASGSAKPLTIVMDQDKSVTGNFQPLLRLNVNSPAEQFICPPGEDEELTVGTVNISVDGVDWQLSGITFKAVQRVQAGYTEAWIEYNSTRLRGRIETDDYNYITGISFDPSVLINEGTTLSIRFFYKFYFPLISEEKKIFIPLDEVRKYQISISTNQISCMPIPASARPGVKLPAGDLSSGTQTIASVWNITTNPKTGYVKINDAVNSNSARSNDIIEVCPCELADNVNAAGKSFTIRSKLGKEVTKIFPLNSTRYIFKLDYNTTLQGFTIDGKRSVKSGVFLYHSSESNITDNSITGFTDCGIEIGFFGVEYDSHKNNILRNDIYENKIGVFIKNGNQNFIGSNLIHHNSMIGIVSGLNLDKDYSSSQVNQTFQTNKQTIDNNTIYSNGPVDEFKNAGDGIYIRAEDCIITNNRIFLNKRSGIEFYYGVYNGNISNNIIYENFRYGIELESVFDFKISNNTIRNNKLNGIDIGRVEKTSIVSNVITDHSNDYAGIFISSSKNINILNNTLKSNCTGLRINDSENIITSGNTIKNSWCLFTGIHLYNTQAEISGNDISDNTGNGIFLSNNSHATLESNNISGNSEYGVNNSDPFVTIDANNNWWGNANGPGNNGILGNVFAPGWLSNPLSLFCSVEDDTVFTEKGHSDSSFVYFRNYKFPDDLLNITISDEQGWITSPLASTSQILDSTGISSAIIFNVPANVANGLTNKVSITAHSSSEANTSVRDSFYIYIYQPLLYDISISPDSTTVVSGDSVQFSAVGNDQYGNKVAVNPAWQTNLGEISTDGFFMSSVLEQL